MTAPSAPEIRFAFTIEAEIEPPRSSGCGPLGQRLHIPITGGRVDGPRLRGRILPGGSDWPVIGPDGNSRIDAHYTIEAEDGTLIYVRNRGIRVSSAEALEQVRSGREPETGSFYMRAAPVFDAPDGPHEWLRHRIFLSTLQPTPTGVIVHVFEVA